MTYFKKINLSTLRGAIFQIFGHCTSIKEETVENIENAFSKNILRILFPDPKLYDAYQFSKKKFKITISYCTPMNAPCNPSSMVKLEIATQDDRGKYIATQDEGVNIKFLIKRSRRRPLCYYIALVGRGQR